MTKIAEMALVKKFPRSVHRTGSSTIPIDIHESLKSSTLYDTTCHFWQTLTFTCLMKLYELFTKYQHRHL